MLEHLVAVHTNTVVPFLGHFRAGGINNPSTGDMKQFPKTAIRMQVGRKNTPIAIIGATQQCCPCSIAKKHAGISILPVCNVREEFGSDDYRLALRLIFHKLIRNGQGVDKTGTSRINVKTKSVGSSQMLLY